MKNRVALVTGGSRGIGKAISLRLAHANSRVLINYFQNRCAAEKTAEEVMGLGAEAHILQADLKEEVQVHTMFEEIQRHYGCLDLLIHNAASGVLRSTLGLTAKHWDWVMDTNARSLLLCAHEAVSMMREGGSIIALSSLGSNRVVPQYGAIGASKAALESLTRYLAVELAPKGISVNVVAAGAVATEMWDLVPDGREILEKVRRRTPSGRLPLAEEVAEVVFFLASRRAHMIQGQVIVVDGGYSLPAF